MLSNKMKKKRAGTPFYEQICEPDKHFWGYWEDAVGSGIPKHIAFKRCVRCGITKFYSKKEESLESFKELLKKRKKK